MITQRTNDLYGRSLMSLRLGRLSGLGNDRRCIPKLTPEKRLRPGQQSTRNLHILMRDRWLAIIFVAGMAIYSCWTAFVVINDRPLDYYNYLIAAKALAEGQNIYASPASLYKSMALKLGITRYAIPYYYPILTALAVWPLTLLPLRVGAAVWILGSGAAALASGLMLGTQVESKWKRRLILITEVLFVPVLTTMYAGQVNNFVLLFTAGALVAWNKYRETAGGLPMGVGIWLKPLALPLVGLLFWRCRWRSLLSLLATSVLVALAGLVAFGTDASLTQFVFYKSLLPQNAAGYAYPQIQNLLSLLARWLTRNPFVTPLVDMPVLVMPLYWASATVLGSASLLILWPFGQQGRPFELEAAFLISTTQLIVPLTYYHHLALVFIPIAVLIQRCGDWRRPSRNMLALTAAYLMMNAEGWLLWNHVDRPTLLLDLGTWAQVIVWVLLVVELRRVPIRTMGRVAQI